MTKNLFNLTNLTLLVALSISTVAAYYSIVGLTAIFAAAVIPIIIMGSILEVGKIVTTVWLRKYWHKCGFLLKTYLTSSVVILAILTSMGIFGFLSKAHIEQNVPTSDIAAQVSLFDEKIKTQRDNIEIARKALAQMDDQINQLLVRGNDTQNAERAVQIRRQQARERAQLQREISIAQDVIVKLNEERAPLASELRKVEAEVGPIKYIAALIYGDSIDQNLLEKAVRWVIIIIVVVFDPLAIALVLAANNSKIWDKESESKEEVKEEVPIPKEELPIEELPTEELPVEEKSIFEEHPYLLKTPTTRHPPGVEIVKPQVFKEEVVDEPLPEEIQEELPKVKNNSIKILGVTKINLISNIDGDYVLYDGKSISKQALKELKPELFAELENKINNFGNAFPKYANIDEIFIRSDLMPARAFKFNGKKWEEVEKSLKHLNTEYIKILISKIDCGEYDIALLSDDEKHLITEHLKHDNPRK
jgi:flagellar basal body-associated protein FliL